MCSRTHSWYVSGPIPVLIHKPRCLETATRCITKGSLFKKGVIKVNVKLHILNLLHIISHQREPGWRPTLSPHFSLPVLFADDQRAELSTAHQLEQSSRAGHEPKLAFAVVLTIRPTLGGLHNQVWKLREEPRLALP